MVEIKEAKILELLVKTCLVEMLLKKKIPVPTPVPPFKNNFFNLFLKGWILIGKTWFFGTFGAAGLAYIYAMIKYAITKGLFSK